MTTTTARIARTITLPLISAGILGGAALGLAGMASAATVTEPSGPGYSYSPEVHAQPAPNAEPGKRAHKGVYHLSVLTPGAING
jgi:hypothetical protein